MAKAPSTFTCTACGAVHKKWAGRCEACGAWNSITEEAPLSAGGAKALSQRGRTIPLTDLASEEPPPPRVRLVGSLPESEGALAGDPSGWLPLLLLLELAVAVTAGTVTETMTPAATPGA